jgi:hypothetical protein
MTADEAEAPQGSTASTENVAERMLIRQRCAVLNRHKMRTPIQCDTHEEAALATTVRLIP